MSGIVAKNIYDKTMALFSALIFIFLFALEIHALPISNCRKSVFKDLNTLAKKISVIDSDDRKTFEEYAQQQNIKIKDVERLFSGSGILTCDKSTQASAQLTGNNSVITTAGHNFFDKDCNSENLKSCIFTAYTKSGLKSYPVKINSVQHGGCELGNSSIDWAVMELAQPVDKDVTAFRLPPKEFRVSPGDKILQVSGLSENFKKGNVYPRYITECFIRDVRRIPGYPVQTDCDSGKGSSGSAQLTKTADGQYVMVAIDVAQTSSVDGLAYKPGSNFNISTPFVGLFYNAVVDALNRTGGEK